MVTQQAAPAEQDKKWCRYCKRLRPITDFRFQNKATGQRHPDCRTCRRDGERAREDLDKRRTVRKGVHKLKRLESLEAMNNWLELLAFKAGGVEKLADLYVEMMTSKDIPISYRITFFSTMMHMATVYDQTRQSASIVKSAEDLKKLNKAQLVEWIRQLRFSGHLSWEDVNPAGDWHGFNP